MDLCIINNLTDFHLLDGTRNTPFSNTALRYEYYSWMGLTRKRDENTGSKRVDVVNLYHADMQCWHLTTSKDIRALWLQNLWFIQHSVGAPPHGWTKSSSHVKTKAWTMKPCQNPVRLWESYLSVRFGLNPNLGFLLDETHCNLEGVPAMQPWHHQGHAENGPAPLHSTFSTAMSSCYRGPFPNQTFVL